MKNVKVEKLPSGSYRIRKQIDGKNIQIVFDHKPDQSEILREVSARVDKIPVKGSFQYCANIYLETKSDVLSVSTIKAYTSVLRALPDDFKRLELSKITQVDVQKVIGDYSKTHKPKTTYNVHGFISAVMKMFRPDMNLFTALPQKEEVEMYIPTSEDIQRILDASKNSKYHICFQLGIMSLRRSEICALEYTDINVEENLLKIDKALVQDVNHNWIVKKTKTKAGTREIFIPDALIQEILQNKNESGRIFDNDPGCIVKALHSYQKKLNIPKFQFHTLRHYFCSFAHSQGMSDANIMRTGGWRSDYTMKSIYRHEMQVHEEQKRLFGSMIPEQ